MWVTLIVLGIWWGWLPVPWDSDYTEKTYYVIQNDTPIRACADITCVLVGHYDKDEEIKSYRSLSEQPEWIDLHGGFIKKSDLRE